MDHIYWHKQTAEKPLFPDLLWSRPENKAHAGKLLIVGGNAHSLAAPAEAYSEAIKAGIGTVRVILPDSLQKTVGKLFPEAEFAPSTPSGSFATRALAELLAASAWADGILLASDFGKNSETAILLEKLLEKYHGQLTLCGDALDYFINSPQNLFQRSATSLVPSFEQLQKLAQHANFLQAFTSKTDLLHMVDKLHGFSLEHQAAIVINHLENTMVAVDGQVSTTKQGNAMHSNIKTATHAAVWWLQNPVKPFEAVTTGCFDIGV
ncbi:MAG TPA: NAD(P)H-hydrate dehydratase [Candidatus Saccharimonadales bacterium]|nr:NAD(P)H-hydrate dehydratase [Candidatus Saccharimonadales bacterium]